MLEVQPIIAAQVAQAVERDRRLKDEFGMLVDLVSPVVWNERRFWALGKRVYTDRPANETFHQFILGVLAGTLGDEWISDQSAVPETERQFVARCFSRVDVWMGEMVETHEPDEQGRWSIEMSGFAQYLLSLAWDVASLVHAMTLPDTVLARLRDRDEFQGARYEIAIAAVFARLGFDIEFLDENADATATKHPEFVATHPGTGARVAVEAKSRRRPGVLDHRGDVDETAPLAGDRAGVRRLLNQAIKQAPPGLAYLIFLDINAQGSDADSRAEWRSAARQVVGRIIGKGDEPAKFNALYITNFSPQYDGDDVASPAEWEVMRPPRSAEPGFDLDELLEIALNAYGRVPDFREGGELG